MRRRKPAKRVMTDAQWYTSVTVGERRRNWFAYIVGILIALIVLVTILLAVQVK